MNIKRRLTGAAAVLLACIAALVFAALVPARAIPPSGGRQYRGIDISEFQGEIDFEEVKRSGIEAVYIRVGAGEYTDEYFAENYERAKRSEEHTSELQSRVDISYAVFCLKKVSGVG